ncbi:hypothetical protein Fmac_003961 [Flemingia macrophylla]|uniref:AMP-dependent synthetase/ligase domain-containing protein n=1 Tax=Flemingia macrophylla TaxID=520843 RepID=A0ABD1N464_9FABA
MGEERFIVEVEKASEAREGRPSMGPVYRSIFPKHQLPSPIQPLHTCWDVFRMSVEKNPTKPMLGVREIVNGKAGKYKWQTYKEVYDLVVKVGNSIRAYGYGEGVKCGIYGANCPEWIISMEACNAHGLYCVPLYDTLAIVSFGKVTPEQKEEIEKFGLTIYSWDEFLQVGNNQSFDIPEKKKTDVCTIMYTSGTTGDPKGVLISNESIVTLLAGIQQVLAGCNEKLHDKDVYLSYLPLAHIFDRVIEEAMIMHGASIGFWRGDIKLLLEDIGELKPTIFVAVPRVLDRVYTGKFDTKDYYRGLCKTDNVQFCLLIVGNLSFLAVNILISIASVFSSKLHNMNKGQSHDVASPLFDKIVFSKVKQGLGGNVRIILSGAAPLSRHVEGFLRVVTCAHILQGYGLTETCAGTFVSLPNQPDMLGTVGPPVPFVDVCLESIPEMGYDALASTPRGEICVKGRTVFSGYYKREDLTKEVMIDGWFHTGDIGEWQPNGTMKIIDRKKNIFKLSQGEYVAVEHLENIYAQASVVESLKGFEFIKAVHLDPVPFDMERGLMTPTFKKKRPEMLKYYQVQIVKILSDG